MKGSKTVTFRLTVLQWQRLAAAAETGGRSTHDMARRLLLEAMEQKENGIEDHVSKLGGDIRQLRVVMAKATVALLVDAGKCTEEAARQWVSDELL